MDLNVKLKLYNFYNTEEILRTFDMSKISYICQKKHKQDFIKIKNFGTSKHTARKMKTKLHPENKTYQKRTSNYRKNSCNL